MRCVGVFVCVFMVWAGLLSAQGISDAEMERWQALTQRVEAAVDDEDTTSETLDALRLELVSYREQFDEAKDVNATRIASLREQIAQLGDPPTEEDAAPEAEEVAQKRSELEEQLATLLAPVQVTESAYTSADGLIEEIDAELRDRQTEALFEVVGSPLNPVHWATGLEALKNAFSGLWVHVTPDEAEQRAKTLQRKLPVILLSVIIGLVLLFRGRRWSKRFIQQVRNSTSRGLSIWQFVISLMRIVVPFFGLSLLTYAAHQTGYLGDLGEQLIVVIPTWGAVMLGFRWVSEQAFAREEEVALIKLQKSERAEARFLIGGITLFLVIGGILQQIIILDGGDNLTRSVVSFPFNLVIAYGLFRIGRLLRQYNNDTAVDEEGSPRASTINRLVRSLGLASIVVAIAAPLLQAAGYYNASSALLFPTILTLIVLGLVLALQRFGADVYGAITGQGAQAREALVPILIGMALLLMVLPVLALVWGARVSDLTEIWAAFKRGFAVGDSRISPTDFITFAAIFTVGYLATRLTQGVLKTNVLPKTGIDKGGQNAVVSGVGYVGIFLAALAAITGAGIDLSSLAIVAGALSVGIGFGLQNIVSNFVSGIILLIERPISEGDWIEVSNGQMGYVRDISVRSTRIETFDRTDVIVPNADLVSGTVTNYTRGNTLGRLIVQVGVAYGSDTRKVEKILQEIANAHPMALANPAPSVLFLNFGASSLDFEIRIFLRDVNWIMVVKNDVNHEIAKRFMEEGIEIPFAQQDVWLRNPEALRGEPKTNQENNTTKASEAALQDAAKGATPDDSEGEGDR
ncbi:small mechanosensitive ion channel protein MscS [Sulfitobacter donghicola DSW-25 = KCTC 12864 = JCM 14565]|uniref:Small mechanosensitive ion channel protein MscS n=2 Tax=Sulfitobacter TaxID=60136 RepID=A0A073IRI4_9RHOB|nr:small mechanosensitive ion channel protein MscS [Sulfitobacter donghicola DSW-25 = KCTC 12864 = JCM 14565]